MAEGIEFGIPCRNLRVVLDVFHEGLAADGFEELGRHVQELGSVFQRQFIRNEMLDKTSTVILVFVCRSEDNIFQCQVFSLTDETSRQMRHLDRYLNEKRRKLWKGGCQMCATLPTAIMRDHNRFAMRSANLESLNFCDLLLFQMKRIR